MASREPQDKESIFLFLRVPSLVLPLHCRVSPNDTLGNLLRTALVDRPWFPIADLRTRPRSLISGPTWPDRTIAECRLRPNEELVLIAAAPPSVCVGIYAPSSASPAALVTLQLAPQDWSWRAIREALESSLGALPADSIAFQQGLYHTDAEQRAVLALNAEEGAYVFVDETEGDEVDFDAVTAFTVDFVLPDSGLHFIADFAPFIYVYVDTEVLRMTKVGRSGQHASYRVLPAESNALYSRRYVLQLQGIRLQDRFTGNWESYIVLLDGSYCSCRTGALFESEDAVVGAGGDKLRAWKRFRLLLGDGDRLPRYHLPSRKLLFLWRRVGTAFTVHEGHLRVTRPAESDGGSWMMPRAEGHLERAVTAAVRK